MLPQFGRRVRAFLQRSRAEREMAEELRFHIESRAADLMASGFAPDEARRRAHVEFGGVERWKDECRDARGLHLAADLHTDVVFALRLARRTPVFVLVAIVSLALGIGANTLAFTIVNSLVLRPLPIADPDRVVFVQPAESQDPGLSYPAYRDLRQRNAGFEQLAGYRIVPMNVELGGGAERLWGYLATENYFATLGVRPALGQFFSDATASARGAAPFAVLHYDFWHTRFAGNPSVIGTTIRINRRPFTIVAVAPRGFDGTEVVYRPSIWVPMAMQPHIEIGNAWLDSRFTTNLWLIGRLRHDFSPAAAEANLSAVAADLSREYPDSDRPQRLVVARPGLVGRTMRGYVEGFTFGLMLLAGIVLLLACVNLAALLTARSSDRQRELAIRLSIGASRGRVTRQLLTEALLLAIAGGLAGAVLAGLGADLLNAWRVPGEIPFRLDVRPDVRVLLFALAVTTCAGLLFGLIPARQASAAAPHAALRTTAPSLPRRVTLRDALVALQVALCVVLVTGSLTAVRGLQRAAALPLGLAPRGVATLVFDLALAGYEPARGRTFQRDAMAAVQRVPGVTLAAYANTVPLNLDQSTTSVFPQNRPGLRPTDAPEANSYHVSPGYFRTVGTRLVRGRDFDERDTGAGMRVAIVNETFVRDVLQGAGGVGSRIRFAPSGDWTEVVGVAEDGKYVTLLEAPRAVVFRPIAQTWSSTTVVLARSDRTAGQVASEMKEAVSRLDPALPLFPGTLDRIVNVTLMPNRIAAGALSTFGLLAVVLAATGLHGLLTYALSRREREIAIRVAIGAGRGEVLHIVLGRAGLLGLGGVAAGFALAVALTPLLAHVAFQADRDATRVLLLVTAIMVSIGLLSCWGPVRRALRIDPASALRGD